MSKKNYKTNGGTQTGTIFPTTSVATTRPPQFLILPHVPTRPRTYGITWAASDGQEWGATYTPDRGEDPTLGAVDACQHLMDEYLKWKANNE